MEDVKEMKAAPVRELPDLELKPKKIVFDPNKSYQWDETDRFIIDGLQLDTLNRAFKAFMSDPNVERTLQIVEGAKLISNLLKENVENGVIKPIE